ncbi:hypothetical protein RN001_002232 [Aquatica leii]|uniref:Tantalus-like domain-containing protein n=1 Tax=Aquatica leii TaxID=1421715 RepID=A0AAN7SD60_9COLE|nr:hypothetical protein RN001_002232 [Aquatica leii]
MGELEIIELNSVLCSMEISKPEILNSSISNINKNSLTQQVIEIIDDDIENSDTYIIEPISVCVNKNGAKSSIQREKIKKKKGKPSKSCISLTDSSSDIITDDSVIIIVDEPMEIVEESTTFSLNESINEGVNDCTDTFVNLRDRKRTRERRSMYNISNLDETIIFEEETDEKGSPKENKEALSVQCKRTLRKRINQLSNGHEESNKVKVKKLNNRNNVEKYYLNKKVKRMPSTLETIFEEPKQHNNEKLFLSSRKLKRVLSFNEDIVQSNKLKSKKRLNKAKKLPSSKKFINRKKLSMETLMNKLTSLESFD